MKPLNPPELHTVEHIEIAKSSFYTQRIRVEGGWLYTLYEPSGDGVPATMTTTFVPDHA